MIPVAEAEARIRSALVPTPVEWVALEAAAGRVLAADLPALRDQPAATISAMDGYAVRAADLADGQAVRVVAHVAAAGQPAGPPLAPGEAARIFTGGLLPAGADSILIQEHASRDGDRLATDTPPRPGQHVRVRGLDFTTGTRVLHAGAELGARRLALAASLGHGHVPVHRRPRIGIACTGDELVRPGTATAAHQIPNSNALAIAAATCAFGGEPVDLGIVGDDRASLGAMIDAAQGLDLLVTSGGASVGDHDLVAEVLGSRGLELDFWKIAMRPGKPLLFGRLDRVPVLGLPGNPVSTVICCLVFLRVAIQRLSGLPATPLPRATAELDGALGANEHRQDFVRATLREAEDGRLRVQPASIQDSSMLTTLACADALIVRPPFDPARPTGSLVSVLPLDFMTGF
ncbi:MAG: gephyrin-like molybdotransferase Glp [Pseudomonadota bacterium]